MPQSNTLLLLVQVQCVNDCQRQILKLSHFVEACYENRIFNLTAVSLARAEL